MITKRKFKVLGIIPARLNSTRLPRKMLADIQGKPLIYYTWKQAKRASKLDEVVVATDSTEIKNVVEEFGGHVILTPPSVKTGSDRVAIATKKFTEFVPDIIINLQGDEPLMPPSAINKTVDLLLYNPKAVMSTVATPLKTSKELSDPGIVKVVRDKKGRALYFSRSIIPFARTPYKHYLKHLGLYGFRRDFLFTYVAFRQTKLEIAESLEQLRALENGFFIEVGIGTYNCVEVNTLAELKKVRTIIKKRMGHST